MKKIAIFLFLSNVISSASNRYLQYKSALIDAVKTENTSDIKYIIQKDRNLSIDMDVLSYAFKLKKIIAIQCLIKDIETNDQKQKNLKALEQTFQRNKETKEIAELINSFTGLKKEEIENNIEYLTLEKLLSELNKEQQLEKKQELYNNIASILEQPTIEQDCKKIISNDNAAFTIEFISEKIINLKKLTIQIQSILSIATQDWAHNRMDGIKEYCEKLNNILAEYQILTRKLESKVLRLKLKKLFKPL